MVKKTKQQAYVRGIWAERLTVLGLRLLGYRVLAKRYKTPKGEIDIVAKRRGMLVFVEVKARKNKVEHGELVSVYQQKRIEDAAILFVANHPEFSSLQMRFDVWLWWSWGKVKIIKQAWLATK